ncbi:MAG: very short patch repair endonuclease [Paracoccaceae bacterium]
MERSEVMRRVKGRDTEPELTLRRLLRAMGRPGYRLQRRDLSGRPDIAFIGLRRAIFVHGCFWHGHACARGARVPKTNTEYWIAKIARNRARDEAALETLAAKGWRALIVWECQMKDEAALRLRLEAFLTSDNGHQT